MRSYTQLTHVAQSLARSSRLGSRLGPRAPLKFASGPLKRFNSTAPNNAAKHAPPPPSSPPPPAGGHNVALIAAAVAAAAGGAYYFYNSSTASASPLNAKTAGYEDYKKVYDAIAKKLIDDDDYDDGSYGPVLVRLAWHSSGTYQKSDSTGGSKYGTMRFKREYGNDSNAGLYHATEFLQSVHDQFPWISYGDLYTLGGVAAVQQLGGPTVAWRAGRVDRDESFVLPDGRLPNATLGAQHVRDVFYRMGFSDQEIVALLGAHALGRCHTQNSGFDGPWTFSPTVFTNDFYKLLLDEKWQFKKWDGPKQYEDQSTHSLMMLPTDYALVTDKGFKKYVEKYAADQDLFFKDFAAAFEKLLELGVEFKKDAPKFTFPVYESD